MIESDLQKKIVKELNNLEHTFAVKIHGGPYQSMGLPDIIVCARGKYVGLEVKMPGKEKTLTKVQARKLQRIRDAGGFAEVVTSVIRAVEIVETVKRTRILSMIESTDLQKRIP